MTLSDEQTLVLRIVATISSSLSVLGVRNSACTVECIDQRISFADLSGQCLYIILSYLLFRELRSTYSGLVFWLSVCDIGAALSWLFLNPSWNENLCVVQGASQRLSS